MSLDGERIEDDMGLIALNSVLIGTESTKTHFASPRWSGGPFCREWLISWRRRTLKIRLESIRLQDTLVHDMSEVLQAILVAIQATGMERFGATVEDAVL